MLLPFDALADTSHFKKARVHNISPFSEIDFVVTYISKIHPLSTFNCVNSFIHRHTKPSLSNQAEFCWLMQLEPVAKCAKFYIAWIPIENTLISPVKIC